MTVLILSLATWDAPPHPERETAFLPAFTNALGRFLAGRQVEIPRLNPKLLAKYEDRPPKEFRRKHAIKHAEELDLGQAAGLNLMDFQVWLFVLVQISRFDHVIRSRGSTGCATTGGISNLAF